MGWFQAYRPSTITGFRERMARAWSRDPADSVFALGLPTYDVEWVGERRDFLQRALASYASASDGHFAPSDVRLERLETRAQVSFSFLGQRIVCQLVLGSGDLEQRIDAICNEGLERTGSRFRFYSVPSGDQCHAVALVTPEAHGAVEARGWLQVRALPGGRFGRVIEGGGVVERLTALARQAGRQHRNVLEMLVEHSQNPDVVVRAWTAEALATLDDPGALDTLKDLLLDLDPDVRKQARHSLAGSASDTSLRFADWWPRVNRALSDPDGNRRRAGVALLAEIGGDESIGPLARCRADTAPAVRDAAYAALRSIHREWGCRPAARDAVPALMAVLAEAEDVMSRRYAAATLGDIGDERAVDALVAALTQETLEAVPLNALDSISPEWPRSPAARAAVPSLVDALTNGQASTTRCVAIDALSRIGGIDASALFLPLLGDPSPGVVAEAARALGRVRLESAVDPLISLLAAESYYVRKAAACALGEIGNRRAVEPLRRLVKDDFLVREAVIAALQKCERE